MNATALGPTIRTIRQTQGLQCMEVASRIPMSRSYYSEIENGHKLPSIDLLADIANALDLEEYELWQQIANGMRKGH